MAKVHRLKHSFSAGEMSPLMRDVVDFERFKNGCHVLQNMVCLTQGAATLRPGFQFIYDLNALGLKASDPKVRLVPFIFNEDQAYVLIFFMHTSGTPRVVFGTGEGLVVFSATPSTECPPGTPVTPASTPGDIVYLEMATGFDIEAFDYAQSGDELYIAQPDLQPHIIRRHAHDCWELESITFTDQPADWSTSNGWPERVSFHQQRLAFAANTLRRQTVWMSQAGDFHNFGVSSPIVESDAVTFTLDSGTQNKIMWLHSSKNLQVGTIGNEWTVIGTTKASLTPSNILASRETNNGSMGIKPQMVGFTTVFVERHGRVINEFVYDYNYDGFKTSDITILAPHLTEAYSITDWAYQQTPQSVLWCVREDGDMIALTYQRQHKVVGWHRHDTQGYFKRVAVIPGDTREDDVWVIVKRIIGGVDHYYVEKMFDTYQGTMAEEGRFLDSAVVYTGAPVSTITGLSHLEGLTVRVLADGMVLPPVTVASGEIALGASYSTVVVGLNYRAELCPFVHDLPLQDGTTLGRSQRVSEIIVDIYRTLGMQLGKYTDEGEEVVEDIPFRSAWDDLGEAVPLFSGFKRLTFMEGFDTRIQYFIRQEEPLPLTVLGVIDVVEVYE